MRLAELIASMSLATDLGLGQPMEHVLRACVLGLRIADDIDLAESERSVVYYVALLAWLGCHADAHEQAAWFGDDIELRADSHTAELVGPAMATFMLRHIGRGEPPLRRARLVLSPRTVGRHVEHVYRKTGCSTRAAASLFAMQHGLLPELDASPEDGPNDR